MYSEIQNGIESDGDILTISLYLGKEIDGGMRAVPLSLLRPITSRVGSSRNGFSGYFRACHHIISSREKGIDDGVEEGYDMSYLGRILR